MPTNSIVNKSVMWNLWHGCHKLSEGCKNCYVYRGDSKRNVDSTIIEKTKKFDLPIRFNRKKEYKIPSETLVYTCFTSDFFVKEGDQWRMEAWNMIRKRNDLDFFIITKRIDRFKECLPEDWGDGYDNVTICCTIENQASADYRLPIYKAAPIKHKIIICEPLLEPIDLYSYQLEKWIEQIVVGGESGYNARECNYNWVLAIREFCLINSIPFWFKQTGSKFVKDGKLYNIKRQYQHSQAMKAAIDLK